VAYCIAAHEDFIAIGSSDGTIRIFDNMERELKLI
jgi:WD40 repeat protein